MTWSGVGGYPGAQAGPAMGGMGNPTSEGWGAEGRQLRWSNDGVPPSIPQGVGAVPETFGGQSRRIDRGDHVGCGDKADGAPTGASEDIPTSLSRLLASGNEETLQAFLRANPGITEDMLRDWDALFPGAAPPAIGAPTPATA